MPAAGYRFERIAVAGLDRRNPLRAARALLRGRRARCAAARALLRRARGSTPCSAAAATSPGRSRWRRSRGASRSSSPRPTATSGWPTALLAPFARAGLPRVPDRRAAAAARYRVTGRPVAPPSADRDGGARGVRHRAVTSSCVLVFGGSLGARTINEAALAGLDGASFRVLHVTGARDWPALREPPARPAATTCASTSTATRFAQALAACDLVVARAGGSIFEIAAYGRPAILVPYPAATRRSPARQRRVDGARRRRGRRRRRRARAGRGCASRGRAADRRPRAAARDGATPSARARPARAPP